MRLHLWDAASFYGVRNQRLCLDGLNVDELAAVATFGELYGSAYEGEQGVVLADAYVKAGVMDGAALTLENVAGFGELAAENLYAETFAFRLTAVLGTTDAFFMCHSAWMLLRRSVLGFDSGLIKQRCP